VCEHTCQQRAATLHVHCRLASLRACPRPAGHFAGHLTCSACALVSQTSRSMQVDAAMQQSLDPWKPYEKSYAENSVLLPFIPRHFYQLRWALMRRNPLCRRVPGGAFTCGELLATAVIAAQMLWMLLHWAIDTHMRTDVIHTGTRACILLVDTPRKQQPQCVLRTSGPLLQC
jgi:hypothetical protein